MVELVKVSDSWVGVCGDVVLVVRGGKAEFGVATSDGVKRLSVTRLHLGQLVFDPKTWFEPGPLANFRVFRDLNDLRSFVSMCIGEKLRGKKVAISFSGGKDSTLLALVLKRVCEEVGCKAIAIYIHMPFIEPARYASEAERLAHSIGIDFVHDEPPRRLIAQYLWREGLPYRRARWCTYLKTRRLKHVAKSLGADVIAVGDRVWENFKRFSRLANLVLQRKLAKKKSIYPVAAASMLDVVCELQSRGLVHSAYRRGCLRVSCLLCPYKSVIEVRERDIDAELEDPGFIHAVLKREWRLWYRDAGIGYDEFVREALWRFVPRVARLFLEVKNAVSREETLLRVDELRKGFSSFWEVRAGEYVGLASVKVVKELLDRGLKEAYIDVIDVVKRGRVVSDEETRSG